jgi:uncharacterized membrane protein
MAHSPLKAGRLEAVSDGVFAIAMTLLVLELKLPEFEGPVSRDVFTSALRDQLPGFVAWLISFAVLARLWIVQHQLLAGAPGFARSTVVWNFVFLGVISFIPFPTSLVSRHPEQPLSLVVFCASYAAAAISLAAMWWSMRSGVAADTERRAQDAAARWVLIWIPAAAVMASALAFVDSRLGLLAWAVILLLAGISKRWRSADVAQAEKH